MQAAGLEIGPTFDFVVKVGNDQQVIGQGKCKEVKVQFPQLTITQDFYLFLLEGSEVVLRPAWLDTLGDARANFRASKPTTWQNGEWITLQADPELHYGEFALRSALRTMTEGGQGCLVQLRPIGNAGTDVGQIPLAVYEVLDEYSEVFQPLPGLPPHWRYDHAITLKEGAAVPNLQPYQYLYYQKAEIERLFQGMLHSRIIRPSVSSYASPIILVKKIGRWQF